MRFCFHTYQECFRTLDGKISFCLQVGLAFPYSKRDNRVTAKLLTDGDNFSARVQLFIDTRKWDVSVSFFSAVSDDVDFENDIPKYAKAFSGTVMMMVTCSQLSSVIHRRRRTSIKCMPRSLNCSA